MSDDTSRHSSNPDEPLRDTELVRVQIEALCRLWEESEHESVTYRADVGVDRALAILAHAHHAVRCARAILALHPDFSGIETSPLCRLLVECAVTAAWLLITPGSGVAMVRDGAKQRVKALSELALTGRDVSELLAQADNVIKQLSASEGPRAFVFEQRCLGRVRLSGGLSLRCDDQLSLV